MNNIKNSPKLYLRLNKNLPEVISISETEIGDLVQVVDDHGASDTKGHVLLRTSLGVVDLFNANKAWDKNCDCHFKVVKLIKGNKLTLTVK